MVYGFSLHLGDSTVKVLSMSGTLTGVFNTCFFQKRKYPAAEARQASLWLLNTETTTMDYYSISSPRRAGAVWKTKLYSNVVAQTMLRPPLQPIRAEVSAPPCSCLVVEPYLPPLSASLLSQGREWAGNQGTDGKASPERSLSAAQRGL